MKRIRWMVLFGLCLVALSAAFYLLQISLFPRAEDEPVRPGCAGGAEVTEEGGHG